MLRNWKIVVIKGPIGLRGLPGKVGPTGVPGNRFIFQIDQFEVKKYWT